MPGATTGIPPAEWDAELQRAGGHFLQSRAWGSFLATTGGPVLWAQGDGWSWLATLQQRRGIRYLYCPYGPTTNAALGGAVDALRIAARDCGADFVRLEPRGSGAGSIDQHGARPSRPVQPRHTWVLDLHGGEEELRRGLSAGHRNDINAAPRRGLRVRRSSDPREVEILVEMLERTATRGGFRAHPATYYRTLAETLMPLRAASLYVAESEDAPVAAALGFDWAPASYYAHAAADQSASRRLKAGAPIVWQMILDARARGADAFDFFGVAPPDAAGHPWQGLSQFKRAFGGRLVETVGTWDLPVRRLRHGVYRAARRLLR